ncbi:hypothetical protein ACTIVE_0365 [Actinomadura verrucosospora]|uniref:Uncharacterized protein n=1 Tax=Actinomadura verrucosospora TaxID=46165 RepID=A0A7D3VT43_ACTVE|nr:hypothetical protein ACTIVE_0365 [Actinomadura verrucosospora]
MTSVRFTNWLLEKLYPGFAPASPQA